MAKALLLILHCIVNSLFTQNTCFLKHTHKENLQEPSLGPSIVIGRALWRGEGWGERDGQNEVPAQPRCNAGPTAQENIQFGD